MIFQQLNRTQPENVYVNVLNIHGQTITTGNPVAYHLGNSMDGVNAIMPGAAGAHSPGFAGVAVRDIPNNDYGRVQVGGFVNSVLISNVGTSVTINAGDPLVPSAAGFFSGAPTYANSGFKFISASNVPVAVSAVAYASGLIKLV